MKIFSILAIVPCLSLQVASSPVEISPLGSDEGIAAKFQKVESDSTHDHQLKRRYAPYPQPYGQQFQPMFQMDAMRLRKFADYLKANMIDFNAIIQTYDSSLEREDAKTINGLITETSTQLQNVREAFNPNLAQPASYQASYQPQSANHQGIGNPQPTSQKCAAKPAQSSNQEDAAKEPAVSVESNPITTQTPDSAGSENNSSETSSVKSDQPNQDKKLYSTAYYGNN
ncbi:hypothetical protein DSO57_1007094 [Entomophthora muscae]|uniref:Uncharacterized protein n=1 Tax=Entomophthora muscae TaxID=34485 RepID=A0ACC2TUY8_9FUNG|nr:hypothetical protein DSO57_1007094 [Entomophthora muscae]